MQKSIKLWFVLIIIMSMFHSNISIYQVNYQSNATHILKYNDENVWGQIENFFNKIHNLYLIGEQLETEIENNIAQKLKNIATNIEVIKNNHPRKITNICDSTNKCKLVMKIQFQNVTRNFILVYNFFATQLEVIREQIMIFFNSEHDFNLTELNKGIDVLEVLKKKIMLIDSSIIVDLLYSSYQLKLNTFRDSFWILITYQKKSFSKKLKLINIQTVNDTIKKVFAWINIFSNLEFTISQKRNDVVAILETKMKEHYYGIKIWISDMMLGNKNLLIGINRFNVNFSLGQKTWTENIALNNVKDEPRLWNMFNSILNNNKLLQLNENNTIADFIRAVNLEAKKIHSEFELKDANFATTKTNLLKDNAQIEFQMILGNEMRLKTIRLNVKEVWKVEGNINRYFERSHYHNWDDIDTYQHLLEIVTSDMKSIYSQLAVSYEDNNIKLQQFVASGRHNINFVVKLNEKLLIKTLTILIPNKQINKIWEKVDTELEKISKMPLYAGSLITDFINKVNIELQTNLSKDLSIVVHYKPNAKIISDFSPMELKVNFGNAVKEKIINFTNLINEANFAELMNNFFTNALDLNLTTKNSLADVISILGNKLQTDVNYINQIKLLANEEYHIVNPISNEEIAKLQPENRLLNEQQDIFTVTDKLVKYNESLSSIKILNYGYLVKLKNIINYEKIEEFVNNISQSDALLFSSDDTKAIAVNKIQSNLQSKIHSQMTLKLTNAGEATTKLKAFTNNDLEFSLNFGINKFIFKVTINKVNVGTNDIDEVEDFFNQEYDLDVSPTSNINDILAKINYQLEQKIANLKVININGDDGNRRFKYLRDELEVILVNNPTKIFKLRLKNIKYNIENERRLIDEYFEDNQIFFNLKNLDDLTEKINNDLKKKKLILILKW